MSRSAQEMIEDFRRRGFDDRVKNLRASYRFDVEGTGTFRLDVDHGQLTVHEDGRPADCTIGCSTEDFVGLGDGSVNMLTAFMQGRVRIEGDLALAKVVHGLLPGPSGEQPREGARP